MDSVVVAGRDGSQGGSHGGRYWCQRISLLAEPYE